jgi:hypothetical protein
MLSSLSRIDSSSSYRFIHNNRCIVHLEHITYHFQRPIALIWWFDSRCQRNRRSNPTEKSEISSMSTCSMILNVFPFWIFRIPANASNIFQSPHRRPSRIPNLKGSTFGPRAPCSAESQNTVAERIHVNARTSPIGVQLSPEKNSRMPLSTSQRFQPSHTVHIEIGHLNYFIPIENDSIRNWMATEKS